MEKTKGNRKCLIDLIRQFDPQNLKGLHSNGKIYSIEKKIFPLKLENIVKCNFDELSLHGKMDPNIKDLTVKKLTFKSITFSGKEAWKHVINRHVLEVSFESCFFEPDFKFFDMFVDETFDKLKVY